MRDTTDQSVECRPPGRPRIRFLILRRTTLVLAAITAVLAALAGPASAATTQIASNLTNVLGILQLTGNDGVRHVWVSDHLNGVCRLDPVGATGQLALNQSTCVLFLGAAVKPAQLSFDPVNKKIYAADLSAKSQGIARLGYDPALDGGRGGISLTDRTFIDSNCGLSGNAAWASALGPDGDLYVGFKKSPAIARVHLPATRGATSTACAADVQTVGNAADGRSAIQVGFIGHDLWETDNRGLGVIVDAVGAARPAGTTITDGTTVRTFTAATPPRNAVSVFIGVVPGGISLTTDSARSLLYVGNASSVFRFNLITGAAPTVLANNLTFVTGLYVDTTAPASSLLVADDTSNGALPNTGRLWKVVG